MNKLSMLLFFCWLYLGCNAQNNNSATNKQEEQQKDTTSNAPKININVNKEYDEEGNMIRFDSTYSYSYSNIQDDSLNLSTDSMFNHFRPYFFKHYPDILDNHFDRLFFNDSLSHNNFFNDDYFFKQFENNRLEFDDMFRHMDSLKNEYFKHIIPDMNKNNNDQ